MMKKIFDEIKKANNITLLTHQKPDPDAIGSVFAFYFMLNKCGKKVDIVLEKELDNSLSFFEQENIKFSLDLSKTNLVVCLDCGSGEMLGKFESEVTNFDNVAVIDHHASRVPFGSYELIDMSACSTCEILYNMFQNWDICLDENMATALFLGIVGDTGRFLHTNTTSKVFNIAGELVECGANINLINTKLFKMNSLNKMQLMQIMLSKMIKRANILYSYLTLQDFKTVNCDPNESFNLVGTLASIENIDIALLFTEVKPNCVNVSLRSTLNFNVAFIAQHFGGGGHTQASGIKELQGNILEVCQKMLNFIEENMREIKNVG